METSKAFHRRLETGWFYKWITGKVIDIGCGRLTLGADPITPDCERHDQDICDAHTMEAYKDESFDTVYSSHVLEHMERPKEAVLSWWRILKTGGHLVISVPERDSYERQSHLPSRWNPDHKTMWVYKEDGNFFTHELCDFIKLCLYEGLKGAEKYKFHIEYYKKAVNCTNLDRPHEHGNGEFSIEIVIKKL
jgi:predicted SAM-dependent methyltransferase